MDGGKNRNIYSNASIVKLQRNIGGDMEYSF